MLAYVHEVLHSEEKVSRVKGIDYKNNQKNTYAYMNAMPLDVPNLDGLTDMEKKMYDYLKKQDIELLASEPKYSTALVNFPDYKAICIEFDLIDNDKAEERMVSLSHELGHYLDVKFNHAGDAFRFNMVYNSDNSQCITMELVAWIYGFQVLKALGYDNTDFFVKQMIACLGTYVGNKKKTVEIVKNWEEIVSDYEEECKKVLSMIVH